MQSYTDAKAFLDGGRDKTSRPIANNTRVESRDGGKIAVKYHATDVVTYFPDGRVRLNTGGWFTYTTKDRLNRFSPARVWADGSGYVYPRFGGPGVGVEALSPSERMWPACGGC